MARAALAAVAVLAALAGCGGRETILPGERLNIRDGMPSAPTATANQSLPVPLPAAVTNAAWTHRGGEADHGAVNPALGAALQPLFLVPIGEGNSRQARITADPVVADGRIFAMDARSIVTAVSPAGAVLWQADLTPRSDVRDDASGGGLATDGATVYVATGYGRLHALDAATGAERWVQDLNAPAVSAPTVSGGLVYIVGRDSRAWALEADSGRIRWQAAGTPAVSTFSGGAGVAVGGGMAVVPFPSGEVTASFAEGGLRRWGQVIAGSRPGQAGGISATDIAGDPVIDGATVYVANAGGRIAAIDLDTGDRIWTATEGASGAFQVAGGSVFLVNDINELVRLSAADGLVIWRVPLPGYVSDRENRRAERFVHYGPVIAGGRLIVASSDGVIRAFDPANGAALSETALPGGAASAPAVAGGALYVITRDGQLAAFR